jgi:hypothetical protein
MKPKVNFVYENNQLWIFGIGYLFNTKIEAEKNRDKKHEKMYEFNFFNKSFFGNVAKYCFNETINNTI